VCRKYQGNNARFSSNKSKKDLFPETNPAPRWQSSASLRAGGNAAPLAAFAGKRAHVPGGIRLRTMPNAPIAQDHRVCELSRCAGHSQSNRIRSKSPSASELFDLPIERRQPLEHGMIPDPVCFAAQHQQLAGCSSG
jgi:hypothetical protein